MNVIVNEENIIRTYSKRQQALAYNYLKAMQLLEMYKNYELSKLSKELKIPYTTLRNWIQKKSIPYPIKTVINPDSNRFKTFLRYFAFIFWDGRIGKNYEAVQLCGGYNDLMNLKNQIETNLKIETGDHIYQDSENSYRLNESNTMFARLLYAAGARRKFNWGSQKIAKCLSFSKTTIDHWIYHGSKPQYLGKEEEIIQSLKLLNSRGK